MEVKSKLYGTPQYKSTMIREWKKRGVICDDFDMLYNEYIKATKCQHCGKDFKSTRDRCLDHDHTTGLFRAFVCQKCNAYDSYIKYPDGYNHKKWMEEYNERNKEYKREYYATLFQCSCGNIIRRDHMARHIKRQIHNNPFCDYPKTNIFM